MKDTKELKELKEIKTVLLSISEKLDLILNKNDVYTIKEASEVLKVSERTIRRLIENGDIRISRTILRKKFLNKHDVDKFHSKFEN